MLKKIFIVFTCLFLLFTSYPIKASAIDYVDKSSFEKLRFDFKTVPDTVYNYDYWILTVEPGGYSNTTSYKGVLYLIADMSYDNFGSTEGILRFYTDTYPYNTKLNSVYTGGIGSSVDYEQSVYYNTTSYSAYSDFTFAISSQSAKFPSSFISGFVFDNFNFDKFPIYQGSTSNYTSKMIIASNVDIYNQYGELLQYGNYYTLLKYFGGTLDASKITDYSGHETAPGVVVEPTTSGGTSGGSQTSKDQLETSKGIWGTVKDIFHSLADLDKRIAESIKGFFTDLKDGLIEGIKYLFIPSDNLFDDIVDIVKNKFGFIPQIFEMTDFIIHLNVVDTPPDLSFVFPENYRGNSRLGSFLSGLDFELIDWTVIEPYRQFIRGLITGLSWYFFIRKLRKRASDVINGTSSGGGF